MKLLIFITCFICLALNAFAKKNKSKSTKKKTTVFIEKIIKKDIFKNLSYPVKVSPIKEIAIKSPITGHVVKHLYKLGQKVSKNQVIVKLQRTDNGLTYKPILIRAPYKSTISRIYKTDGLSVNQGEAILELTDQSRNLMTVEIPGDDISKLQLNQIGYLKFNGENNLIEVKISQLSKQISTVSGTSQIILKSIKKQFLNVNYAIVDFKLNKHKGFLIKENAFHYKGKEIYINTVDKKNKIIRKNVKIKEHLGDFIELESGLNENDIIVIKSSKSLKPNEIIKIGNPIKTKTKTKTKKVSK